MDFPNWLINDLALRKKQTAKLRTSFGNFVDKLKLTMALNVFRYNVNK